jgi:D-beta-D-heptose 7-phosphate kinase/D-beta-D-heptose 1-phosphate adenosyltransferase
MKVRKNLLQAVKNFKNANILLIGDLMLDVFIRGKVKRISPEAPVPVVEVVNETTHLGGAANVVQNIMSLGGKVTVCGIVGNDDAGRQIIKELQRLNTDCSGIIQDATRPTTIKTRVIAHHQQVVRFDRESKDELNHEYADRISDYVYKNYRKFKVITISDYGKGVISRKLFQNLVPLFRKGDLYVVVDPKVKNYKIYSDVTILTPNIQEAQEMVGFELVNEDDFSRAAMKIIKEKCSEAVLITRSEQGMTLVTKKRERIDIPTVAKEVFDVTGAGDTVVALLSLGLANGLNLLESATIANHAAGIVVGKLGTATVTPQELISSLRMRQVS